jgi:hypothetical protein
MPAGTGNASAAPVVLTGSAEGEDELEAKAGGVYQRFQKRKAK